MSKLVVVRVICESPTSTVEIVEDPESNTKFCLKKMKFSKLRNKDRYVVSKFINRSLSIEYKFLVLNLQATFY